MFEHISRVHRLAGSINTFVKLMVFILSIGMLGGFSFLIFLLVTFWIIDHVQDKLVQPKIDQIKEHASQIIET